MAFTEYTGDTTIIGALGTNPAERALTTQEFKDKFDQFADEFVTWFNATHLPEVAEKAVVVAHLAKDMQQEEVHGLRYEEGTWTPYIGGNYVGTYSEQYGQYTKIGKRVFCDFTLTVEEKTSGSQALIILGMPFDRTSTQRHLIPLTVFDVDLTNYIGTYGRLNTIGSFWINVYFVKSDGTSEIRNTGVVKTGTTVRGSFSYLTP